MPSIFSGLKIIDLTKVYSGPLATRMFADYGAEVLKIENSESPDDTRFFPPLQDDWSGYYEILNRNKKSISMDLKDPNTLTKFYDLCSYADVVVENLTPQTKVNLHIDYRNLSEINPKIIYASLSGLGQSSNEKYYDIIAQAQSGLMSLTGNKDEPMKIGPAVVDAFSGMTLAFAIASALFYREKTSKGQYIDVSMLASSYNLLESNLIASSITHTNPIRTGNLDNLIAPFGTFKTKDGYIALAIGNKKLWEKFLGFLKKHIEIDEQKFSTNNLRLENIQHLKTIIERVFADYANKALLLELKELTIPVSEVKEMLDVLKDEFSYTEKFLIHDKNEKSGNFITSGFSIKFSEQNTYTIKSAPNLGDNNDEYGI